ncbi:AraC family transcriptional regulator [Microbacterium lushaniae]|nr:AraC family transcriptional regulator [Microbacterium lushaniae]KAA9158198.1 AraC family transcriptional regulator [Microbacterium lushaniae]
MDRARLARLLHTVQMRSTFYCHAELAGPWALEMPAIEDSVSFHVVTNGSCWLRLPGSAPLELRRGDLALVPHGRGHDLASSPAAGPALRVDRLPQEYIGEQYSTLRHGGTGEASRLICGIVSFDAPAARELMRALPAVVTVRGDELEAGSSVHDTLRTMARELSHPQIGGETVATRLADVLVLQAIRAWIAGEGGSATGWMHAVQDERIGRALEAIHDDPGRRWNLQLLAHAATMSRSAFSARFTELTGEAPIAYLARWRMALAQSRLAEGDTTVAALADELGYRSEAAFHRAFTRIVGRTPGSIRRRSRLRTELATPS